LGSEIKLDQRLCRFPMATSAQRLLNREETGMIRLRMSYQEWLENIEEHVHREWVDGEAIIYPLPGVAHREAEIFLAVLLKLFLDLRDLGKVIVAPFEMRLASVNSSREPDIVFIAKDHFYRLTEERLEGPCDLAVEILSKWTAAYDRHVKLIEYAMAGIPECWLIDSRPGEHRVELFVLGSEGQYDPVMPDERGLLHSEVVPGFWVDPRWFGRDSRITPTDAIIDIAGDEFVEMLQALKRD
jgi:Uma2 family endonuclease